MNLRDLVGKTAIRTAKSDVVFPWELPQSLFVQVKPYGTSCHSDKEKYMNHPVKIIAVTVDQFIANVCEEKIGKIVIPEKKSTWSDEVTYKPLSEYVGERFELFLTEKRYDRDGRIASYSSDRKLSAAGLLTSRYLEEELGKKVEKLIANAKREVEESLIKSLEQNLKENLAKDTIERMNIPEVLKKLSSIGAKQVTGTSLPE